MGDPAKTAGDGRPHASVLLVDDNIQNLELLEAYLEELDIPIRTATDGAQAIAMIESEPPAVVLLDVMMPRMSGFQACERIKSDERTRDIPVVLVTALNEVADQERGAEVGADDFLTKPVNRVELLARVRSLLEVSRLRGELGESEAEVRRLRGE